MIPEEARIRAELLTARAELLTAFADGELQYKGNDGEWYNWVADSPPLATLKLRNLRRKPRTSYRPWELAEVPVGAVVRPRVWDESRSLIHGASTSGGSVFVYLGGCELGASASYMFSVGYEWKWPGESDMAFRKCGVPEPIPDITHA